MTRNADIQERLRNDIIAGYLGFGDRLRIDNLASRYGVSHMPVREALRVLHGEGLIVVESNRGARVRPIHPGFVEDLFDLRGAIETMLARRAAERRSQEHITKLTEAEERLEQLVANGNIADVPPVNREFHNIINEAAGNPGALQLVDGQWLLMAALWRKYGNAEERFYGVIEDHRHMIRSIERRDAHAAATLMGSHIEKAKQDLLDRMRTQSDQAKEVAAAE
jgi:DNA-binding GntR family transcriptional regulator